MFLIIWTKLLIRSISLAKKENKKTKKHICAHIHWDGKLKLMASFIGVLENNYSALYA